MEALRGSRGRRVLVSTKALGAMGKPGRCADKSAKAYRGMGTSGPEYLLVPRYSVLWKSREGGDKSAKAYGGMGTLLLGIKRRHAEFVSTSADCTAV